jgi:hypothetical protein
MVGYRLAMRRSPPAQVPSEPPFGVDRYRPTTLEILAGTLLGDDPGVESLRNRSRGLTPLQALEAAVLPAVRRPPCGVSFSGGRDSSIVLAAATTVARREGLPLPIPVTLRFPSHVDTREDDWQQLMIAHLGLADWVRLSFDDELDGIGPIASGVLRDHGVRAPSNWYLHRPLFEAVAGGALLTGVGGDELFGSPGPLALRRHRGVRGLPREMARLGLLGAPGPARRRVERRQADGDYHWLRPGPRRAVATALAKDAVGEPRRWNVALRAWWRTRALQSNRILLPTLGQDSDVLGVHPFLDEGFLAEVAEIGGITGFVDRSVVTAQLFGSVVPPALAARRTKATFDTVCFGPMAREFALNGGGERVDTDVVDHGALIAEWTSPYPDARSLLLLQAIWLGRELFAESVC